MGQIQAANSGRKLPGLVTLGKARHWQALACLAVAAVQLVADQAALVPLCEDLGQAAGQEWVYGMPGGTVSGLHGCSGQSMCWPASARNTGTSNPSSTAQQQAAAVH